MKVNEGESWLLLSKNGIVPSLKPFEMNICVLASTNGTDLQSILDQMKARNMKGVKLKFVLTNKEKCGAAEKARKAKVKHIFLNDRDEDGKRVDRSGYDRKIIALCEKNKIDLIVLVGWMRMFSLEFVRQFPQKIINVHPSLLPKYKGMDKKVHQKVLDSGDKETGMTIHYVNEGMDTGEIILQKRCEVKEGDTVETLKKRVQALEKEWYPKVIVEMANG
jgi:phosphoribosylglycinamide formyltransferase 1